MRLLPPTISPATPSPGEVDVFKALAATHGKLGEGWTVMHSFDIANPATQLAAEIDFLCIVPGKGVLVLEVKGCRRLRRADGLWFYGGERHGDLRGPFKQAADAMHTLKAHVTGRRHELSHIPFWSAVCFPYIDFQETSEEWNAWQVIDRRDLRARPLAVSLEAVLDRARHRLVERGEPWFHAERGEPTPEQCRTLVDLLRGDFEFFESPKARSRRLDDEVRHYTEEQFEALDAIDGNARIVFDGPAGTGKTLLAIEAARRAAAAGRTVLLLCFNRPLGRWLQDETRDLEGVVTRTLHEHMRILAGVRPTPAQACSQEFWQEELPALATAALVEAPALVFDEVVLDEAQDMMRRAYLDFLDLSVRGGLAKGVWRFFGDFEFQRIYDVAPHSGRQVSGVVGLQEFLSSPLGGGAFRYELRVNCRNTPRVAGLACACGHVLPGYSRVRRPDDEIEPEIRFWRDERQQAALLVQSLERLREEGFTGPRVAVLSPRGDDACAAATVTEAPWRDRLTPLVQEARVSAETAAAAGGDWPAACIPSDLDAVDLRSGKTRYCSIYRFKGLEAAAVIITDIRRLNDSADCSLLYVGCTRALHRLVILAHESLRGRLG